MSKDAIKQQLFEACDKNRVAALLLDYFMSVHSMKTKRFPDDLPGSSNLWMDFTRSDLAGKLLVSESTVKRATLYLARRGFITIHKPKITDRTIRYELHLSLVQTLFQELPLFEGTAIEQDDHLVTMTSCNRSPRPDASGHHDQLQQVTMTSCYTPPIPSPSLPHPIIKEAADAETVQTEKEKAVVRPVAAHGERPGPGQDEADPDREKLIDAYRATGIAKERTEAHLTKYTRQKLQAGLDCLQAKQRLGTRIVNPPGFLNTFLHDPGQFGYELDPRSGHWRPAALIHLEAKQHKQAIKARDSPLSQQQAAAIAWDSLTTPAQQAIRIQLTQSHPDDSPARRLQRCREHALLTTQPQDHSHDEDAREAAETRQSQGRLEPDRVQGAPR